MKHFQISRRKAYLLLIPVVLFGIGNIFISCEGGKAVESREAQTVEVDGLQIPDGFSIERVVDPALVPYLCSQLLIVRGA